MQSFDLHHLCRHCFPKVEGPLHTPTTTCDVCSSWTPDLWQRYAEPPARELRRRRGLPAALGRDPDTPALAGSPLPSGEDSASEGTPSEQPETNLGTPSRGIPQPALDPPLSGGELMAVSTDHPPSAGEGGPFPVSSEAGTWSQVAPRDPAMVSLNSQAMGVVSTVPTPGSNWDTPAGQGLFSVPCSSAIAQPGLSLPCGNPPPARYSGPATQQVVSTCYTTVAGSHIPQVCTAASTLTPAGAPLLPPPSHGVTVGGNITFPQGGPWGMSGNVNVATAGPVPPAPQIFGASNAGNVGHSALPLGTSGGFRPAVLQSVAPPGLYQAPGPDPATLWQFFQWCNGLRATTPTNQGAHIVAPLPTTAQMAPSQGTIPQPTAGGSNRTPVPMDVASQHSYEGSEDSDEVASSFTYSSSRRARAVDTSSKYPAKEAQHVRELTSFRIGLDTVFRYLQSDSLPALEHPAPREAHTRSAPQPMAPHTSDFASLPLSEPFLKAFDDVQRHLKHRASSFVQGGQSAQAKSQAARSKPLRPFSTNVEKYKPIGVSHCQNL